MNRLLLLLSANILFITTILFNGIAYAKADEIISRIGIIRKGVLSIRNIDKTITESLIYGATKVNVNNRRIGVLLSDKRFLVSEGIPPSQWVLVETDVDDIYIGDNKIVALKGGLLLVKASASANWTEIAKNVTKFKLDNWDKIAFITKDKNFNISYSKEKDKLTYINKGVEFFDVAGRIITYIINGNLSWNNPYVNAGKEDSDPAKWIHNLNTNIVSVRATYDERDTPLIALKGDNSLEAFMLENPDEMDEKKLKYSWTPVATNVAKFEVASDTRLGVLLKDGTFLLKDGFRKLGWGLKEDNVSDFFMTHNSLVLFMKDGTALVKFGIFNKWYFDNPWEIIKDSVSDVAVGVNEKTYVPPPDDYWDLGNDLFEYDKEGNLKPSGWYKLPTKVVEHLSFDCGIWGPYHAEITCDAATSHGHCWANFAVGPYCQAKCECEPGGTLGATPTVIPPPAPDEVCDIKMQTMSCPSAGLHSITDPGCSIQCNRGFRAKCASSTCSNNTWTQSICYCVAK